MAIPNLYGDHMKKASWIILMTLLTSSASFSYTITIDNETGSEMTAHVNYAGAGFCSPDVWEIKPYSSFSRDVGGCCTMPGVKFEAVLGFFYNRFFSYDPPRTGFGLSCRSWHSKIVYSGYNFIVESR